MKFVNEQNPTRETGFRGGRTHICNIAVPVNLRRTCIGTKFYKSCTFLVEPTFDVPFAIWCGRHTELLS